MKLQMLFLTTILISFGCSALDNSDVKSMASEAIENGEFEKAYDLLIDGARNGNPEFQHTIALIVSNGYGPVNDQERDKIVLKWLEMSAEQGFPDSIAWLADAYQNGWFGLEKDLEEAERWRSRQR